MEFCSGGDVADYLRKHKRVSEATARSFLQQLSTGLQELWRHHFVHVSYPVCNPLVQGSSSIPQISLYQPCTEMLLGIDSCAEMDGDVRFVAEGFEASESASLRHLYLAHH